MLQICLYNLAA